MRFLAILVALVLAAVHIAAQATCPPTITVTADPANLISITSSSHSRQVVYTTEFETIVVNSNGSAIVETMARLVQVESGLDEQPGSDISTTTGIVSCPDAVTITIAPPDLLAPTATIGLNLTTGISSLSPSSTILNLTSVPSGIFPPSTIIDSTSLPDSPLATSSIINSTSSPPGIFTPSASLDSTSTIGISSTSVSHTSSSIVGSLGSTTLSASSLAPSTVAPTSSSTSNEASTSSGNTTSTGSVAASSYGVALDVWSTPTPTLQCAFPCQLKMPCMSLPTPTTITFPPYTTTLCKAGCSGSVQMKSTTTITLPVLTTDSVCFYPMSATGEGPATPVPRWITDTMTVDAPAGLSTCPPVFARPDTDGKCGPDNHYMCERGLCCGKDGKCGTGQDFCENGCQLNYGDCWKNSTSCDISVFADTDDMTTPIPIFPVLYDDDDNDVILPPITIIPGAELDVPVCRDTCDDVICGVLGCDGECGMLSCSSIDFGWFKSKFPKTDCHSAARKVTCTLFKIGCCPEADEVDDGCTVTQCTNEDEEDEIGVNGDTNLCDPEKSDDCGPMPKESEVSSTASSTSTSTSSSECSSTTTVTDQTAHCEIWTASNGKTSTTCTSTATGPPRKGCSIQPSTITSFTSGCETQTASHVTNACTVLTGAGNDTRTECTSIATTFSGCDVTGSTTTSAMTECSNSNTVTNITSSCFATNITSMGLTFPGSGTCTGATSTVFSGCDLSGTVSSVTSYIENVCEFVPSDITIIPIVTEAPLEVSASAGMSTVAAETTGGALGVLESALSGSADVADTTAAGSTGGALGVLGSALSNDADVASTTAADGTGGALGVLESALSATADATTIEARWWKPFGV